MDETDVRDDIEAEQEQIATVFEAGRRYEAWKSSGLPLMEFVAAHPEFKGQTFFDVHLTTVLVSDGIPLAYEPLHLNDLVLCCAECGRGVFSGPDGEALLDCGHETGVVVMKGKKSVASVRG